MGLIISPQPDDGPVQIVWRCLAAADALIGNRLPSDGDLASIEHQFLMATRTWRALREEAERRVRVDEDEDAPV